MTVMELGEDWQMGRPACKQRGYKARYEHRRIYPGKAQALVSVKQIQPEVERIIAKFDQLADSNEQNSGKGGVTMLARLASPFLPDIDVESIPRRILAIRRGEVRQVDASMAEAILAADEIHINNTDIMEVPATKAAARERIDVALEMQGFELPLAVRRELADDLYEFTLLMIHGPEELFEGAAEDEEMAA